MPTITPVVKPRGRPRKSAVTLGAKTTVRTTAKRAIKDSVNSAIPNKLLAGAIIAGLGAIVSFYLNKK